MAETRDGAAAWVRRRFASKGHEAWEVEAEKHTAREAGHSLRHSSASMIARRVVAAVQAHGVTRSHRLSSQRRDGQQATLSTSSRSGDREPVCQ